MAIEMSYGKWFIFIGQADVDKEKEKNLPSVGLLSKWPQLL